MQSAGLRGGSDENTLVPSEQCAPDHTALVDSRLPADGRSAPAAAAVQGKGDEVSVHRKNSTLN